MSPETEISLNGVHYAFCAIKGKHFRVGSLVANWRDFVLQEPVEEAALAREGIWVREEVQPPLPCGVMCCGLGSFWPGMGRSLYDNFPVARAAMDRIAALADWDVLGLMAETDMDCISQTRWQIPYLFLLEYAQWCQFRSLGLTPRLICGHSLGELLGLCFSGIYTLPSVWYLLETRAMHMAELERRGEREGGMLAVPADRETIAAVLKEWPNLRISNRNTRRQYILSGPREELLKARKHLRRERIPAVMLNMDLAFHNPAMRILRTISWRRLMGLPALPAKFPLLSCVDSQPYPEDREAISKRIADLDENAVDWVSLLETIEAQYPCSLLVELGPQETLCGITAETLTECPCIPADRKGHEAEAMRAACARLFAEGFLEWDAIEKEARKNSPQPASFPAPPPAPRPLPTDIPEEDVETITDILGEACKISGKKITLDMDLRQDLGIRSSSFPFLMLEAERRLGHPVILENLFQITTVADLVLFLLGRTPRPSGGATPHLAIDPRFLKSRRPIGRYAPGGEPMQPIDPLAVGMGAELPFCLVVNDHALGRLPITAPINMCAEPYMSEGVGGMVIILAPDENTPSFDLPTGLSWLGILRRFPENTDADEMRRWFAQIRARAGNVPLKVIAWAGPEDPAQLVQDCADLLELEICHAPAGEIVWKGVEDGEVRFCKNSAIFKDIFPDSDPPLPTVGTLFQGLFHLSGFADTALAENSLPGIPPGSVTPGKLLQLVAATGKILLPRLVPIGFTDFHVKRLPTVSPGITRECRISSLSRFTLMYEGAITRICNMAISVATLGPYAGKNGEWEPVGTVACLMGATSETFPAIWHAGSPGKIAADRPTLAEFYAHWKIGSKWQLLAEISEAVFALDGEMVEGYEATPASGRDAAEMWLLLDAVFQGALWTLLCREGVAEPKWESMGFIRFAAISVEEWDSCRIQWRISWRDKNLIRFDAQICGPDGNLLATLHNLEFNNGLLDAGRNDDGA